MYAQYIIQSVGSTARIAQNFVLHEMEHVHHKPVDFMASVPMSAMPWKTYTI
jgi:hypothetical protein